MAHDRTLDHYGTEEDSTTVLSADIGPYPAGTSLHDVLVDMVRRIAFVEANPSVAVNSFTANAIVQKTTAATFSANAVIVSFLGSFTANAWIQPSFTADAWIVEDVTCP